MKQLKYKVSYSYFTRSLCYALFCQVRTVCIRYLLLRLLTSNDDQGFCAGYALRQLTVDL